MLNPQLAARAMRSAGLAFSTRSGVQYGEYADARGSAPRARMPGAERWRRIFALLCLLLAGWLHAGVAQAEEEYLDPDKAFAYSAATQQPGELAVHFDIAPGYYMYRKRFEFAVEPAGAAGAVGAPVYPAGIVKYDPTFEENMEVYYDQVTVLLPLAAGKAAAPLTLSITSQGCADAGLCYPPDTRTVTLTPVAGGYAASGDGIKASVPPPAPQTAKGKGKGDAAAPGLAGALNLGDTGIASYLASASVVQIVLLCLVLGLLLSFTPCVLPMVPILLAILAGTAGTGHKISRWRGLSLAAIFVLGMSLVYTVLGVVAGLVGAGLAAWFQTPWVLGVFAVLLAIFALAMFDVFTLQAPAGMQTALNARLSRMPGGHYSGVFLMGMVSALIVGPCVAAPLAGVLLFISQTGDVVLGGSALFALAWGEGLLLLAVGASSGVLLPKAGPWMNGIKYLFGVLLLATAWWMVNSVLPGWLYMLGWAVLALWSAAMMGAFQAGAGVAGPWVQLRKALGLLLAAWAVLLLVGLAAGGRDILQPLAPLGARGGATILSGQAQAPVAGGPVQFTRVASVDELDNLLANTGRPVMLDFYADWCVSCVEMERFTFSDPRVAQLMSQMVLVQADVTKNNAQDRALLKRFKLFGPPGIIFFDAQGRELTDIRVVGFMKAAPFAAKLEQVLATGATRPTGAVVPGAGAASSAAVSPGVPTGRDAAVDVPTRDGAQAVLQLVR